MFIDIEEFHKKFNLKPLEKPGFLDYTTMEFRIKFMQEELAEFMQAYEDDNLHDAFDALIDLTYVVLGTAYLMNLPFNAGWKEVHNANMKKIRAVSEKQSKRNHSSDVIKPEGWAAPNLNRLLQVNPSIDASSSLRICYAISSRQYIGCPYTNAHIIGCQHAIEHIYMSECDLGCGSDKDLICGLVEDKK